jgi:hypothetical protein
MRKPLLWLLVILSLLGGPLAADKPPFKLVRLTVINKSSLPIAVKLTGDEYDQFYYLKIPKGSREHPVSMEYTVVQDNYAAVIYYLEYWDPVYGYKCSSPTAKLDASHSSRLTVVPCTQKAAYSGEPGILKLPSAGRPRRGLALPR